MTVDIWTVTAPSAADMPPQHNQPVLCLLADAVDSALRTGCLLAYGQFADSSDLAWDVLIADQATPTLGQSLSHRYQVTCITNTMTQHRHQVTMA